MPSRIVSPGSLSGAAGIKPSPSRMPQPCTGRRGVHQYTRVRGAESASGSEALPFALYKQIHDLPHLFTGLPTFAPGHRHSPTQCMPQHFSPPRWRIMCVFVNTMQYISGGSAGLARLLLQFTLGRTCSTRPYPPRAQ